MVRPMGEILIGTSGYDYAEWVGAERFYPPSLQKSRGDWLTYYASQFPLVELNFTYYGETSPQQLERMLQRVDPGRPLVLLEGAFSPRSDFGFVVKAYATLTHQIEEEWPAKAARFVAHLAPLKESGRLIGVLAQFPARFRAGRAALEYVVSLSEALAPVQLIAEFRHRGWFADDVRTYIERNGIAQCGVDAPREAGIPSLLDDEALAGRQVEAAERWGDRKSSLVYVRLHGRSEGRWWAGNAASRYEYRYSENQLLQLARRLLASSVERTYVLFNNHRHADAAKNAKQLEAIVADLLKRLDEQSEDR